MNRLFFLWAIVIVLDSAATVESVRGADRPVDYGREVKPLLSQRCYACHGPDKAQRKAGLQLDVRDRAVLKVIKPGDAAHSRMIQRIASTDMDEVMPPPESRKERLTPEQVDVIRRWIDQGAKFNEHWAYVKPLRPPLPTAKWSAWPANPIDYFVAAGHQAHALEPSPPSDRVTLIRRLYFDLIGLPPSAAEVEAFVHDSRAAAYDLVVDRLLGSEHFGERMAVYWLDLVRFADSAGYHSDNHRDLDLYRDYVIRAFNSDMPFDRFTREQLAGDLLPMPTTDQKIASAYNRLLMTTEEGGAQAKEYTAKYAADRVRNASVVWLASTMGCCECHDHKFDPFKTRDFYSLAAFFADVSEVAVGRQPEEHFPSPEQSARLSRLDEKLTALRARLPKTPVASPPAKAAEDKQLRQQVAGLEAERNKVLQEMPATLISMSSPPRVMRILPRGNWQDESGPIVSPAVPGFLPALEVKNRRGTRLDLARWLVSPENPLTARVVVNRLWKLCFGQGLVKTLDDFGVQGDSPSHAELLDWLAVEFMESGWDIKHMLRLMVESQTYRQSSLVSPSLKVSDPLNRWLARQGRFRLDAEMIHDNALAVSGLLSQKVGGRSVKPYQPAGYWAYLNFPIRDWIQDHGEDLYRRGLYTYWQRSYLHPSLLAFDAPSREECTVERPRSSTPLQALVLLNDPIYVEAARVFAERILREGGHADADRLNWAYREALSRPINQAERGVLEKLLVRQREVFATDKDAAQKLIHTGEWRVPANLDATELAAWTNVARVIFNLHEMITRN